MLHFFQKRLLSLTLLLTLTSCIGTYQATTTQRAPTEAVSLESQVQLYSTQKHHCLASSIKESIAQAQQSILIFTFTLSNPEIIQALNERANAGVKVTVVIDQTHLNVITSQKAPGIEIVTRRTGEGHVHHKLLVIDEKEVSIGSANFTIYENQENLMFRFISPEIAQLLHQEADVFRGNAVRREHGPVLVELLNQTIYFCLLPHDGFPPKAIEKSINNQSKNMLLEKINGAKSSIKIAMMIWTDTDIANAIAQAHHRGIKVQIVAPDIYGSLIELNRIGIFVKLHSKSSMMHNKFMCIDDTVLINGSANWTRSAFSRSDESFLIIESMTTDQRASFTDYWTYLLS